MQNVEEMMSEVLSDLGQFNDVVMTPDELDPIETEPYSGFIPFTDGGFEIGAYADFRAAHGSGCVPNAIQEMLDSTLKDCAESFVREKGLPEGCDPWDEEEVREEYWDWEDTWLSEGCTYFYKVRAIFYRADNSRNETGSDEWYFWACLNVDLEYGRDSVPWFSVYGGNPDQCRGEWSETVKAADITPDVLARIRSDIVNALESA